MPDPRRLTVLFMSLGLMITWGVFKWRGDSGGSEFAAAACGRIGLVLGGLWLAWDSLRRPARWLPPSIAVGGIVVLLVLAAQPRLIIAVIPAVGMLLAISAVVRMFKSQS